jgi:integrase
VLALIEALADYYRAIIVVAAGTGLRQGEVFGLAPDRVDFLRRQLVVDAQLVLPPGAPPYVAPPKTAASYRTVPLADVVLEAVAAHMKTFPPATASDETGKERPLVFSDRKGRPLSRTHFHQYGWAPVVRAAGLPVGTHFHELRHFYASLLIDGGESVKAVQTRLGHANAEETLNTYAHLWPESEDRAREAVQRGLALMPAQGTERRTT